MKRALILLLACGACSADVRTPAPQQEKLPEGAAARAGSALVSVETVQRIVDAQAVEPKLARERAIQDALAALAIRGATGSAAILRVAERAALGRVMLDEIKAGAIRQGPPTDSEISQIVRERWHELDRPEAAQTTHAVVTFEDPKLLAKARMVAERLAATVRGTKDPAEFLKLASQVPADGLEIRAERLPPVTRDGRTFNADEPGAGPGPNFDRSFAEAAHALREPGEQSGIVKTPFGFHVILLERRLPPRVTPRYELKKLLADEVVMRRSQRAERDVVNRMRQSQRIEVDRAVDDLMARVRIAP